jgi:hypothetical protein
MMCGSRSVAWSWLGVAVILCGLPPAASRASDRPAELVWHTDYAEAVRVAQEQHKTLFIYFRKPVPDAASEAFETRSLVESVVAPHRDRYVWARLPLDVTITVDGQPIKVLKHDAFRDMRERQGIAMVDYVQPGSETYGYVVSQFPFPNGMYYKPHPLSVILDLPSGTLTQRTMIFAVRIHPETPGGASGQLSGVLSAEAEHLSRYQAQIRLQGHHHWDTRFHRINARLPSDLLAQEVVAESWPNEELVDAAIECVHSWRRSDGHWSAVRQRHPFFAFDMKRGRNGIWYATGLFANRRGR